MTRRASALASASDAALRLPDAFDEAYDGEADDGDDERR